MSKKEQIDLSPDKEIYRSAAVDVSYLDAIEELIDNAIDNWTRTSRRTDDVTISIEADGSITKVRDNTGGLGQEQIHMLFALGETFQTDVPNSIGAYGIGAKKAIVRLGESASIKSRAQGADVGTGFRVNKDWLNSDDWKVDPLEFPGLEEGVTEIAVESEQEVWDEDRLAALSKQLGKTYGKFIQGDMPQGGSVTIELNDDPIEPGNDIPWSFTPFDGHHPRRYEGIELYHSSLTEQVQMNVTVGHMRNQDSGLSGTDFYCQDRLVLESNTAETGGFGSSAENKIGNFTNQNNRLKVIVELKTEGDSSDLPWDGQKSDIDAYHPVTRMVHDWLRRIVKPYFKADAGKLRKPYVDSYTPDSDEAANDGEIQALDYSGRERMGSGTKHKAKSNIPRVNEVEKMVKKHAAEEIKYTGNLADDEIPAYETRLKQEADVDFEKLENIESLDELEEDEVGNEDENETIEDDFTHIDNVLEDVEGAGESRRNNLYTAGYETVGDLRAASTDDLTAVDGVGRRVAESIKEAVSEDSPEKEEHDIDLEIDGETNRQETDDGQNDADTDSEDTIEHGGSTDGEGSESSQFGNGAGHVERDGEVTVPLVFDEDTYELVRRQVGSPDDANVEDVGEILAMKIETMYVNEHITADD